jgi:hypothetical protein
MCWHLRRCAVKQSWCEGDNFRLCLQHLLFLIPKCNACGDWLHCHVN